MTLDPKIAIDVQEPAPGEFVILFELDTSLIISGGATYYFTQSRYESTSVQYNSQTYFPFDVEADGFEFRGKGQLPRPTIKLGLIGETGAPYTLRGLIRQYGDLVGSKLTRRRTFRKYLDGQSDPDTVAQFPPDIYKVERKAYQDKAFIEWELSSYLDNEGKKLPGRQILRDSCTHRYRTWVSGTTFDYTYATCPYNGASYFNKDGDSTTAENDRCGYRLSDCKLRFPNAPLPTRAFPGVARVRL